MTGNERLAWDQRAPSLSVVNSYTFTLFIDGSSAGTLSPSCSATSNSGTFTCSAPFPSLHGGVHVIAIRTTDQGGQSSALSAGLTITVQAATTQTMSSVLTPLLESAALTLAQVCVGDAAPRNCYQLDRIATNLEEPNHPTEMPDGRLVILDRGVPLEVSEGAARTVAADVSAGSRLAAISVPPDSATTREVYALEVTQNAGARVADVVRFRDVGGVLGQRAVVVPGIPLPGEGDPALLVDKNVLVAIPHAGDSVSMSPGLILSYNRDGTAAGRAIGSPALAWGPGRPAVLMATGEKITAAGLAPGMFVFGSLGRGDTTPSSPVVAQSLAASGGVRAVARAPQLELFAAGDGSAYVSAVADGAEPLSVQKIDTRGAIITGLATTHRGTIVATARLPLTSGSAGRVYELTPVRN